MAMDTFMAYAGVYADVDAAKADYEAVHDLHTKAQLIDAYDAAVIERKDNGKVKIVKKHETPTRSVAWAARRSASRPVSSSRCSRPPRSAAGCSWVPVGRRRSRRGRRPRRRGDEPQGPQGARRALDAGQAGLVVVGVSDMGAKVEAAMAGAEKVQEKQLSADSPTSRRTPKLAVDAIGRAPTYQAETASCSELPLLRHGIASRRSPTSATGA